MKNSEEQAVEITPSFADILAKLTELEAKLNLNEESREIWTCADVARYFKMTPEHIRRWVVTDPRFPAPVDLYSRTGKGRGNSKNRYIAGEVIKFALTRRKK